MRAEATAALPDTAAVWRLSASSDGRGGWVQAYALSASAVPCRLAATAGRNDAEQVIANRLGTNAPYVVTLAHDVDVRQTDRLVINGLTLEVVFVDDSRSDLVSVRVACEQVGE